MHGFQGFCWCCLPHDSSTAHSAHMHAPLLPPLHRLWLDLMRTPRLLSKRLATSLQIGVVPYGRHAQLIGCF